MADSESKHDTVSLDDPQPMLLRQETQPAFPIYHRRIGNPSPLGILSFAASTFILSLFNLQADGITVTNIIVGMALAVGGPTQLLAGMWEFAAGNTFGATAFTLFSGFWMSYGMIFVPGTGILDAYTATTEGAAQLHNALGIYLMTCDLHHDIRYSPIVTGSIRTHYLRGRHYPYSCCCRVHTDHCGHTRGRGPRHCERAACILCWCCKSVFTGCRLLHLSRRGVAQIPCLEHLEH